MTAAAPSSARDDASDFPVFVVGCPRSGTTLLYHTLVSTGAFADYRAETHLFDIWGPRFGSFRTAADRARFHRAWTRTRQFERSGLEPDEVRRLLSDARCTGAFLKALMGAIARSQGVARWAECTPAHLLYMMKIKEQLPTARFIHIIRDGRDVALSLRRLGWVRPLPWDRDRELLTAGMSWEWMLRRGRLAGQRLGDAYTEVRFEDLVQRPAATVEALEGFIDHPVDYDAILEHAVGSVARPNTAFGEEDAGEFRPVARWKRSLSEESLRPLERVLAGTLTDLGYELATVPPSPEVPLSLRTRRLLYHRYRSVRQWSKDRTGLSRLLVRIDWPEW